MSDVDYSRVFTDAVRARKSSDWAARVEAARNEIDAEIESACVGMAQTLSPAATVELMPWISSSEAYRRQVVFRRDGQAMRILIISMPVDGYPVHIAVEGTDTEFTASDLEQLQDALVAAFTNDAVLNTIEYLRGLGSP